MGAMLSGLDGVAMSDPAPDPERMMTWVEKHVADARMRLAHAATLAATTGGYTTRYSSYVQIAYKRWSDAAIAGQPSCCGIFCCGMCRACSEGSDYMNAVAARGGPVSTVMLVFPRGDGIYEWKDRRTMLVARATRREPLSTGCCAPCGGCCCVSSHRPGLPGLIRDSYLTVSECLSSDWNWREIACTQEEVDRMVCFAYANRLAAFDETGARHALVPEIRACLCPVRTLRATCAACLCWCPCCASRITERKYYCASFTYAILCAGGGKDQSVQRRLWANAPLVWHCPMDCITPTNLVGAIVTTMIEKTRTPDGVLAVTRGANYIVTPRTPSYSAPAFKNAEVFLLSPSQANGRAACDMHANSQTAGLIPSSRAR